MDMSFAGNQKSVKMFHSEFREFFGMLFHGVIFFLLRCVLFPGPSAIRTTDKTNK